MMPTQAAPAPTPSLPQRVRRLWFPLVFVAFFAWIDWITHRSFLFLLLVGGGVVFVILFREQVARKLQLQDLMRQLPTQARPFLVAAPPLLYFMVRGQGTSDAGILVVLISLAMVAAVTFLGSQIDQRLIGFYAWRNRFLPQPPRAILAIVAAVLVAFLVVHGSLADLPALFGAPTRSPASPTDRTGRLLLGIVLAGSISFLLLREARRR